jgi:hypothetical protein
MGTETPDKRQKRLWAGYAMMTTAALLGIGGSLMLYLMAGVAMHDRNFDTFQNVLTPDQQKGIILSAKGLMLPVIAVLASTNLGWIIAVGAALARQRKE